MKNNEFTLIISGLTPEDDHIVDALYEAGCDDALLSFRGKVAYLNFNRESDDFKTAVLSAIKNIESVDGLKIRGVEPSDIVSMSEIAKRLNCSRESIRQNLRGLLESNAVPPLIPVVGCTTRDSLWSFVDVATQLNKYKKVGKIKVDKIIVDEAKTIYEIDSFLKNRDDKGLMVRIKTMKKELESLEN